MNLAFKIWLDQGGKAFGDGPCELLKRVEKTRSLHRAAGEMAMSYSKAWGLLRSIEKRLGFLLIERKVGGPSGGGSRVTREALAFMRRYETFRREVDRALGRIYVRHFGRPSPPKGRHRPTSSTTPRRKCRR